MKKIICVFILIASVASKAQTFIGQSESEITEFCKKCGYTSESSYSDPVLPFHSTMYSDPKQPVHYLFEFGKNNKCITYTIWTPDNQAKDVILKDIEMKSAKMSKTSWRQRIDNRIFQWNYQGTEGSSGFVMTEVRN